jgi:serine/threonine-protein kinase HipA
MNPSIERRELTLAINEVENSCDVSIAMETCTDYGLPAQRAGDVLKQVESAVAGWRDEASRLGIPEAEQSMMAAAFQT